MALERVLMTCRIRRCEVESVHFVDGVAVLSIASEPHRLRGMAAYLSRLVSVVVETLDASDLQAI